MTWIKAELVIGVMDGTEIVHGNEQMNRSLAAFSALALTLSVSACATTTPPTAEQLASCEQMMATMGEAAPHDHSAEKTGGVSAMGMTHAQCRRILER